MTHHFAQQLVQPGASGQGCCVTDVSIEIGKAIYELLPWACWLFLPGGASFVLLHFAVSHVRVLGT